MPALSSGAVAGITIAGSVLLLLLITVPFVIRIARRRGQSPKLDAGLHAEQGYLAGDDVVFRGPRRLHKRGTAEQDEDVHIEGRDREEARIGIVRSLSRYFSVRSPRTGSGSGVRLSTTTTTTNEKSTQQKPPSPEKLRGRFIHQHRREASWIDEDALHGPRVSPRKSIITGRNKRWLTKNRLTRTLSRRFTIRQHPDLEQSPTLPCTEGMKLNGIINGSVQTAQVRIEPLKRVASLSVYRDRIVRSVRQQTGSVHGHGHGHGHSSVVMNAACQLAGKARVPSLDIVRRHPGASNSAGDAEVQAILRQTAEKLQDGDRSNRRRTVMLPISPASGGLKSPERKGRVMPGGGTPSSTQNRKSAPSLMVNSDISIGSPQRPAQTATAAPWQSHRRSHAQQVAYVPPPRPVSSLTSPVSIPPKLPSQPTPPSKRNSQADVLASPIRIVPSSPLQLQQPYEPYPYSPVSEQSSALSTVYSEEEGSPSTNTSTGCSSLPTRGGSEVSGTSTIAQALRASYPRLSNDDGSRKVEGRFVGATYNNPAGPWPRLPGARKAAMTQKLGPPNTPAVVSGSVGCADKTITKSPADNRNSLKNVPSSLTRQSLQEDPFTTPARPTSQRLSQACPPLPAKPNATTPPVSPVSPTSSLSRKRMTPSPLRSCPSTGNSPLSEKRGNPQYQTQSFIREPSPVISESGLSSVYESYRYDRHDNNLDVARMLAQLRAGMNLTVPRSQSDSSITRVETDGNIITANQANNSRRMESFKRYNRGPSRSDSAVPRTGVFTQSASAPGLFTREAQQCREISFGNMSHFSGVSVYSQDDGADRLAPLVPLPLAATKSSGSSNAMRVTSAVAQLRRMDSQISYVSEYSAAQTSSAGYSLSAIRGTGRGPTPGKREVSYGTKNYLSLGGGLAASNGEKNAQTGSQGYISESGTPGNGRYRREDITINHRSNNTEDKIRNGAGRPRPNSAIESYEQDLSHARQVHRKNRGADLQTIPEGSRKSIIIEEPRTPVKSRQERTSFESLGLYDEKGFLKKTPSPKKSMAPHT
ncbi:hypothetical protein GGR50DRAFT_77490 [Xylaria sp. CBS 124048]|nr:hypothetical protein GGR50DRAFT_77490 [Xylaria sp. CBS 124048]